MEWRTERTVVKEKQVQELLRQVNKITKAHDFQLSLESKESFTTFSESAIHSVLEKRMAASEMQTVNRLVSKILTLMGY